MSLATDAGVIEQSLKRLEVITDKNEAVFSAEDLKENERKENEKEDFQEDEEPEPTEQDEDLHEE